MPKQRNFFYSQFSTLPEEALANFYLSTTFGLSFMISSVAPTRSSTFYAYLTLFHMTGGGGGGADSALLQLVFFIISVRDAAEPRNLLTFPKI